MRVPVIFSMAIVAAMCVQASPARCQSPDASATAAADAYFAAKDYDHALAAYQQVEAASTDASIKAYAHTQTAECYGKKGDHAKARKMLLETADTYPGLAKALARALLRSGDYALADQDLAGSVVPYERLIKALVSQKDPDLRELAAQAAVHVARARLRFAADARSSVDRADSAALKDANAKLDEARQAWERVASDFSDRPDWQAEAKLNLLEIKQQDVLYGRAGDYPQIIAGADAYLQTFPDDAKHAATARLIKAEAQFFDHQYDAAIQTLGTVDPAAASPAAVGTAQRLLAQCYDHKGNYARAIAEYQKFLDSNQPSFIPHVDRPLAQYGIGMCLRALGRKVEAKTALQKVAQDYPTSYLAPIAARIAAGL